MKSADEMNLGIENISTMKWKTHTLVSTVVGLMKSIYKSSISGVHIERYTFGNCRWMVTYALSSVCLKINVTCMVQIGTEEFKKEAYSSHSGELSFDLETVQSVFESRNLFLEAMWTMYPELKKKCQPFLRAADIKF